MRKTKEPRRNILLCALCCALFLAIFMTGRPTFAGEPAAASGLRQENGALYYYEQGSPVQNKWVLVNGKKYYFQSDGAAATGSVKIKNKYYIFNQKGVLYQPKSKKLVTVNGVKYYVTPQGTAGPSDLQVIKKKVYYIQKDGSCAAGKKVGDLRFNKDGTAEDNWQALATIYARRFIAKNTRRGQSKKEKLRACWNKINGSCRFRLRWSATTADYIGWEYKAAASFLSGNLTGNCFGISSSFAAVARELGYKPYVVRATWHAYVRIGGGYFDNMHGAKFYGPKPRNLIIRNVFPYGTRVRPGKKKIIEGAGV